MPNANSNSCETSPQQVTMRSSLGSNSNRNQPASVRRRSLNISHFNALQNAVSNLARIDDFYLEELGYGYFSDVFKATHKQSGNVMVLKRNKDTNSKMNILREVQLMNRLSHTNILKFKGVCVHEGQLHALTEFINGGDLEQLITKKKYKLSWKQRIQIAHDIASGMKYLHNIGIFHRDLSAKNCLVSVSTDKNGKTKFQAVVADLGLAEKIPATPEDEKHLALVGTPYIMAPEVIHTRPYNEKADLFSYGLILCQLMAQVSCDPEELPRSSDFGLARDTFHRMVMTGDPNTSPPNEFLQLAYDCCQVEAKNRPSFQQVVARLESLLVIMKKKKRSSSFRVDEVSRSRYSASKMRTSQGASNRSPIMSPSKPPKSPRTRRPSSASRLSRSFSDISRELLTHAANMALSANGDQPDDEAEFANPFSALEHLNNARVKLTDEPSLALLEMTFDIAKADYVRKSWAEGGERTDADGANIPKRRQSRPKSVFASFNEDSNANAPSPPMSLNLSSPAHTFRHRSSDSVVSSTRSPCSTPDRGSTGMQQQDNKYKMAVHRAMILSPRGNNLASWWCARRRAEGDSDAANERQSLASVLSVLSRHVSTVRRSISLPDVSRISTLFHTHEPTKPNGATSGERKPRSRTDDEDVFYGASSQGLSNKFGLQRSPKLVVSDHDDSGSNGSHRVTFAPNGEAKLFFAEERDDEDDATSSTCGSVANASSAPDAMSPHSISSSSSGCSSSGLLVCAAEMTQKRRKDPKTDIRTPDPILPTHSCMRREKTDHRASKSGNRDSGYEEDHPHPSIPPILESGNAHVVWSIQENGDTSNELQYASCSHGGSVTDWNSNERSFHPSKYKLRSDPVL